MKKKFLAAILAGIMMVFTLASCSSPDADEKNEDSSAEASPSEQTEAVVSITDSSAASTDTTPATTEGEEEPEQSSGTETEITLPQSEIDYGNSVVLTAEALIGIPFAENGSTPDDGFDNSGFIYYVLRENGFINCPRLTYEQANMGTKIGYGELKSGDLAFFCTDDSGNPDFGGIYIGGGRIIYCPMPGQTVKEADITTDYWKNAFVTGVSLS